MKTITREELLWFFEYDRGRGKLYWKNHKYKKMLIGKEAGNKNTDGHMRVNVNRKSYFVHQIVYFLEIGYFPEDMIDHINGDKTDNRFINLRVVNNRQNQQNRNRHRNGKLVGASFHKGVQKWQSNIQFNKRQIYLGCYDTELEAHQAYLKKLNEHLQAGGE